MVEVVFQASFNHEPSCLEEGKVFPGAPVEKCLHVTGLRHGSLEEQVDRRPKTRVDVHIHGV